MVNKDFPEVLRVKILLDKKGLAESVSFDPITGCNFQKDVARDPRVQTAFSSGASMVRIITNHGEVVYNRLDRDIVFVELTENTKPVARTIDYNQVY